MASAESPYKSPFLKWKGLRRWSRGPGAPSLSKLIRKAKTRACKLAIPKLLKLAGNASSSSSSSCSSSFSSAQKPPLPPPSAPSAPLPSFPPPPSQGLFSMQRSTSFSHSTNALVGALAIANCLRRHSDAIAHPGMRPNPCVQQRFSLDSAHPYYTTTYLNNEEHMVPNMNNRLGSSKANTTSSLTHNTLDFLSMGSPLVTKVKDTCAQMVAHRNSSHHPLDLFIGNPFLTRVNPAPVTSSSGDHLVTPSLGLFNASIKARNSELKDRIVFFL